MPADISMYCLNTLHSFSFCCDYISLKVICASLSLQHKCSLTFDSNIFDLIWMCCDARAVCSVWVITPIIKAHPPSDPCWEFPCLHSHPSFMASSSRVSLSSPLLSFPVIVVFPIFTPSCPLISLPPPPVVLISGENHPAPWRSITLCVES